MINRRDAIRRFVSAGAVLAFPARAQPNRIVLGQSAAFTGPAAQLGIQMNKGARIYFDALNANGGVNGNTIEPKTLDDGYAIAAGTSISAASRSTSVHAAMSLPVSPTFRC